MRKVVCCSLESLIKAGWRTFPTRLLLTALLLDASIWLRPRRLEELAVHTCSMKKEVLIAERYVSLIISDEIVESRSYRYFNRAYCINRTDSECLSLAR